MENEEHKIYKDITPIVWRAGEPIIAIIKVDGKPRWFKLGDMIESDMVEFLQDLTEQKNEKNKPE